MENNAFGFLFTLVEFILLFGLLVFLHELGHYLMAKLVGIDVEEFGFGFPPRLVKLFQFRETEVTLNWIPFGAFVRPKGENDPAVPGGMASASPIARLGVLFGGPVMNVLTGILLFSILFTYLGAPQRDQVQVQEVSAGSPAEQAGLKPGDLLVTVNGETINSIEKLQAAVSQNLGKEISIVYARAGQQTEVRATPRVSPPPNQGALGIIMGNPIREISWAESIPLAGQITLDQGRRFLMLPVQLIQGSLSPDEGRFVGPVGIFNIFETVREQDASIAATEPERPNNLNTIGLLATLSVALGLTNLLPIPALDGGRILFVLPELILRRRIPARYENMIHFVGFVALILLMIYVTTQDIINPITLP
jgi:regulator of sigma E protease